MRFTTFLSGFCFEINQCTTASRGSESWIKNLPKTFLHTYLFILRQGGLDSRVNDDDVNILFIGVFDLR